MSPAPKRFHVLSEHVSPSYIWILKSDGLFDTKDGTLRGYSFPDNELVPCAGMTKKHDLAACLGARFDRFEVSWSFKNNIGKQIQITRFMSLGELSDLLHTNPASLRIKGLM